MLEPWLELEELADDTFAHAHAAGAQLARLHTLTAPAELRKLPIGLPNDLDELFAVDATLASLPRAPAHPAPKARVFCHGDFHPDQVLRKKDGLWLLMDLDCLAAGDPAADLANWIADWIVASERVHFDGPAAALLDGYRSAGATLPARGHLLAHVAAELVNRAGATLRRLEQGAIAKARFALQASIEVVRA
jgi:aminoglycoside phosphotransferase (APT) family kinase protein